MKKKESYIAYYRVSTKEQGNSKLGLQAQRKQVIDFTKCQECIVKEFTEIESGRNDNRLILKEAIQYANDHKAILVIAKLDRLSRNVSFISQIMDSKVKFVCADMPEANEFTIHIFAALAQQERKMISERTKKALAAKKAQGHILGTPENLTPKARKKAVAVIKEKALNNENNIRAAAYIKMLKGFGFTYEGIANELNRNGFKTSTGKSFNPIQAQRLYIKFKGL